MTLTIEADALAQTSLDRNTRRRGAPVARAVSRGRSPRLEHFAEINSEFGQARAARPVTDPEPASYLRIEEGELEAPG